MTSLPKGVYDELLTAALRAELDRLPGSLRADIVELEPRDAVEYIARKIADRVRSHLARTADTDNPASTIREANRILAFGSEVDAIESSLLRSIHEALVQDLTRPVIPLAQSALVTNDQGLNYHRVLQSELLSSDQVDLICPFIGNQGLNLVIDSLAALGKRLRVITTTYLGCTNQRALERLAQTGAQVKIVYERSEQKTGLHAKAWIFHRDTGFTTATIGSSNLSPRALVDGLEWNVRVSGKDASQVLQQLIVTFDRLWEDPLYELYDQARDSERLKKALRAQRQGADEITFLADLSPLPHQQEALDELKYARLEGKTQNLIVAATGTGKTLLAAFDYRRLAADWGGRPSLLFVAHRGDILKQSIGAFRAVMKNEDFGELNVGTERSDAWRHVFASIQSLHEVSKISRNHFDVIVIDEFHHAEAPTYVRLLDHFQPKQLLGLTATPERTDGKNVIERFGNPTYELRLWHALDRNLLCPFHYFGINDDTDLSSLDWLRGRYSDADLENQFVTHGTGRASLIIRELLEKVDDIERLRAVAFCATIKHAEFMASEFQAAGIPASPLHSGLRRDDLDELMRRFRIGDIPIVCTVDLFNEGIDVPEINTVLFLRPTESATVFVQQLGRGLRNHPDKGALTVLDFVGQQNKRFRMDLRFRALTGFSRLETQRAIKAGFPMLPPGCHIRLDRTTTERVLRNLQDAIPSNTRVLVEELKRMYSTGAEITLDSFLHETGLEPADIYKPGRSFASLKHAANLQPNAPPNANRIGSFLHVDDKRRIAGYRESLTTSDARSQFEPMLYALKHSTSDRSQALTVREEMLELLYVLDARAVNRPAIANDLPFALHAKYTRDEIVSIFREKPEAMRQGTFYVKDLELDIHLVTLRKSERDFSPTTRYADYFVAPDQLHWESQSTTTTASATGQRLARGLGRHLFFVRENRDEDGRPTPFVCVGFAHLISSEGEKPISVTWRLEHTVPDHLYVRFRAAAG